MPSLAKGQSNSQQRLLREEMDGLQCMFQDATSSAVAGSWDAVQEFLSAGGSINHQDLRGNTLLHAAVQSGQAALVQVGVAPCWELGSPPPTPPPPTHTHTTAHL